MSRSGKVREEENLLPRDQDSSRDNGGYGGGTQIAVLQEPQEDGFVKILKDIFGWCGCGARSRQRD